MASSKSCIHPIYIYLTGATRLREGWFGRLIMQVQMVEGGWRDATARDLKQIEFIGSSSAKRRKDAEWVEEHSSLPPPDWRATGYILHNGLEWS